MHVNGPLSWPSTLHIYVAPASYYVERRLVIFLCKGTGQHINILTQWFKGSATCSRGYWEIYLYF